MYCDWSYRLLRRRRCSDVNCYENQSANGPGYPKAVSLSQAGGFCIGRQNFGNFGLQLQPKTPWGRALGLFRPATLNVRSILAALDFIIIKAHGLNGFDS